MNENGYEKLRQIRLLKKITLKDLAKKCGLSYSYISQVERGEASPSLQSLDRLSKALGVSVWQLLMDENDASPLPSEDVGHNPLKRAQPTGNGNSSEPSASGFRQTKLVKKDMRRSIVLPKSNILYEMITPALNCKLQILIMEAEPGTNSGDYFFEHQGEECCYVLSGRLETEVGGESYVLEEGDSLYFASELPHRWVNVGKEKAVMMIIVSPPAY